MSILLQVSQEQVQNDALHIPALVVSAGVGTLVPILNGLLTKVTLPSAVKGVITIILSAIVALITSATLADGTAVISWLTFLMWFLTTVGAIAAYVNIYKPLNLTSSTPNGKLAPNSGIGPDSPPFEG
jgi:hypothetical protein